MRSYISGSDSRVLTWLVALGLTLAFIASWETFWRGRGFIPSVNDDTRLWALARSRASEGGRDAVVLVGSSRMQVGLNPDAFVTATGWRRPVQLAIAMGPSIPVLQHLANDPSFSGTVICELNPIIFFDATLQLHHITARYIQSFEARSFSDGFEERLALRVQRSLVSRLPALFPGQLRRAVARGEWPEPHHVITDSERFQTADYLRFRRLEIQKQMMANMRANWKGRPYTRPELVWNLKFVEGLVQRIRGRGGEVVFVRFPSSDMIREDERRRFPRTEYWDVVASEIGALAIHFEDYPELSRFHLLDGDHLDQRQAIDFSRALGAIIVRELKERKVRLGSMEAASRIR